MDDVLKSLEEFIEQGNFERALQVAQDSQRLEKWMEHCGTQLILLEAFCLVKLNRVDSSDIRKKLETLHEHKIMDAPEFY